MLDETENKPKCLVEYKGKSLLKRQLEIYENLPIDEIGIVTGYKNLMLEKFLVKKFHNFDWNKSNMIHSLSFANKWLMRYECIISYSDIFFEKSAITSIMKSNSDITILYDKNWKQLWEKRFKNPLSDAETLKLDKNNKILEIGKKTQNYYNIEAQFMGIFKTKPNGWKELLKVKEKLPIEEAYKIDTTSIFQKIIEKDIINIQGIEYTEKWGEVDTPTDLEIYNQNKN